MKYYEVFKAIFNSRVVAGIIPNTFLGPVNDENTQSSIEFLKTNLQYSFSFLWQINPDLKVPSVLKLLSSFPSFFLSFLAHKNMFPEVL